MKILIITGRSNHNWIIGIHNLKKIFKELDGCEVKVDFKYIFRHKINSYVPNYNNYNVIVFDYNGPELNRKSQIAFEQYMAGGGGLIVYHSGGNAFPLWEEYNRMIGIAGWGNRDYRYGHEIYISDRKIRFSDNTGIAGYHGRIHSFYINNINTKHSLMYEIPNTWFHSGDEIYENLRGFLNYDQILASTITSPEFGGSGREVPVAMAIKYHHGRIFHTTLGHCKLFSNRAMMNVGFRKLMQNGALWVSRNL